MQQNKLENALNESTDERYETTELTAIPGALTNGYPSHASNEYPPVNGHVHPDDEDDEDAEEDDLILGDEDELEGDEEEYEVELEEDIDEDDIDEDDLVIDTEEDVDDEDDDL
jgi:hypothetical protein